MKYMRGLVALPLQRAKNKFNQMYLVNGSHGILATLTPKKQEKNETDEMGLVAKEMNDPVTAFSRPPPLPPVIGPLVALSLLDAWWNSGSNDDRK